MEKICIVKRRQKNAKKESGQTIPDDQYTLFPIGKTLSNFSTDYISKFPSNLVEEFNDYSGHVISITMTEEQSIMLNRCDYIKELLTEARIDPALDVKINAEGKIVLNFHFNNSMSLRMLRCDQVCQMLQISRSFLQKLIHENTVRSYKIGRLRRFLFEDILEFLLNKEKFAQFKE
jgi:excisionase family DNA binding protein